MAFPVALAMVKYLGLTLCARYTPEIATAVYQIARQSPHALSYAIRHPVHALTNVSRSTRTISQYLSLAATASKSPPSLHTASWPFATSGAHSTQMQAAARAAPTVSTTVNHYSNNLALTVIQNGDEYLLYPAAERGTWSSPIMSQEGATSASAEVAWNVFWIIVFVGFCFMSALWFYDRWFYQLKADIDTSDSKIIGLGQELKRIVAADNLRATEQESRMESKLESFKEEVKHKGAADDLKGKAQEKRIESNEAKVDKIPDGIAAAVAEQVEKAVATKKDNNTRQLTALQKKVEEQEKKIEEQGEKIEEQGKKIEEQGKKIESREAKVKASGERIAALCKEQMDQGFATEKDNNTRQLAALQKILEEQEKKIEELETVNARKEQDSRAIDVELQKLSEPVKAIDAIGKLQKAGCDRLTSLETRNVTLQTEVAQHGKHIEEIEAKQEVQTEDTTALKGKCESTIDWLAKQIEQVESRQDEMNHSLPSQIKNTVVGEVSQEIDSKVACAVSTLKANIDAKVDQSLKRRTEDISDMLHKTQHQTPLQELHQELDASYDSNHQKIDDTVNQLREESYESYESHEPELAGSIVLKDSEEATRQCMQQHTAVADAEAEASVMEIPSQSAIDDGKCLVDQAKESAIEQNPHIEDSQAQQMPPAQVRFPSGEASLHSHDDIDGTKNADITEVSKLGEDRDMQTGQTTVVNEHNIETAALLKGHIEDESTEDPKKDVPSTNEDEKSVEQTAPALTPLPDDDCVSELQDEAAKQHCDGETDQKTNTTNITGLEVVATPSSQVDSEHKGHEGDDVVSEETGSGPVGALEGVVKNKVHRRNHRGGRKQKKTRQNGEDVAEPDTTLTTTSSDCTDAHHGTDADEATTMSELAAHPDPQTNYDCNLMNGAALKGTMPAIERHPVTELANPPYPQASTGGASRLDDTPTVPSKSNMTGTDTFPRPFLDHPTPSSGTNFAFGRHSVTNTASSHLVPASTGGAREMGDRSFVTNSPIALNSNPTHEHASEIQAKVYNPTSRGAGYNGRETVTAPWPPKKFNPLEWPRVTKGIDSSSTRQPFMPQRQEVSASHPRIAASTAEGTGGLGGSRVAPGQWKGMTEGPSTSTRQSDTANRVAFNTNGQHRAHDPSRRGYRHNDDNRRRETARGPPATFTPGYLGPAYRQGRRSGPRGSDRNTQIIVPTTTPAFPAPTRGAGGLGDKEFIPTRFPQ